MPTPEIPSEALLEGRRALDGVSGCRIVEDLTARSQGRWSLRVRLETQTAAHAESEPATDWYLLVSSRYPLGAIDVFPAEVKGIEGVRQHQSGASALRAEDDPWLAGNICVRVKRWAGFRGLFAEEPKTPHERLAWYVERTLAWLEAARTGSLTVDGDPFELPQVVATAHPTIAFSENSTTIHLWGELPDKHRVGLVDLIESEGIPNRAVVEELRTPGGAAVLRPKWGSLLQDASVSATGAWVRLPSVPIVDHWRVPRTWGELRRACESMGRDLDDDLKVLAERLRDGRRHLLMIGFPIPRIVGGSAARMHWWAVELPVLAQSTQSARGFRKNALGRWQRDRTGPLSSENVLLWHATENWDEDELSARGRLGESLRALNALVIGTGALGSMIAEQLVRGGVNSIALLDHDRVEPGNLVRHVATLRDTGRNKALAMRDHLSEASPHVCVEAFAEQFPPSDTEARLAVECADLIIDATGEDETIDELEAYAWDGRRRLFCLVSFGFDARRLFVYFEHGKAFSAASARLELEPWVRKEVEENRGRPEIYEPIGCYHPLFPASVERVSRQATLAVSAIDNFVARSERSEGGLIVFDDEERPIKPDPTAVR